MGRWLFLLGTGLAGAAFLAVGVGLLTGGSVEISATEVSIDDIESNGFPDANYLTVTGGTVLWAAADANRSSDGTLSRITAPIVSRELMAAWDAGETSGLRLAVRFDGETIEDRWPDLLERANLEGVAPEEMTVTGETVPGRFYVGPLPWADKEAMRVMWLERHGLASAVSKLIWGGLLLAVCVVSFIATRSSRPARGPVAHSLDLDVVEAVVDSDDDVDLDD